jgi:hypothetical protein
LLRLVLGAGSWDAWDGHMDMGAGGGRRHTRTSLVGEDQSKAAPGPAGDGAPCLSRHRCWISMGRCRGGQGGHIPALEEPRQEPGRGGSVGPFHSFRVEGAWGQNGVLDGWGGEGRGSGQGRGVPPMGQASMGVADWQLDEVYYW